MQSICFLVRRMFLVLWIINLVGCVLLFGQAQKPPAPAASQATPVPPAQVPFAVAIKKAVVFIETDCQQDGKVVPYAATAFFVFKPDERLGNDRGFEYLVTNRHAAQPGIEEGNPCRVVNYGIRLNLHSTDSAGQLQSQEFSLGSNLPWSFPEDPSVDLAVLPLVPDPSKVDVAPIPTTMFVTDEIIKSSEISEGDPVIFSGLFVQFPGLIRLEPIVREGVIAMMPTEPIMTTLKRPGDLYLADVHVFGGNSGSPMFVNLGGFRNGSVYAGNNYRLLGVVSGYEQEDTDFNLQAAITYSGKLVANSGVTSVVPAKELDALLNSAKLQAQRDEEVKREGK